jgi:hypothetical protein
VIRQELPVLGPLRREPRRIRPPFDIYDEAAIGGQQDRVDALREALGDVELGDYDHRIVEWLATWDVSVVGTIVSWIYRVRQAGVVQGGEQQSDDLSSEV